MSVDESKTANSTQESFEADVQDNIFWSENKITTASTFSYRLSFFLCFAGSKKQQFKCLVFFLQCCRFVNDCELSLRKLSKFFIFKSFN